MTDILSNYYAFKFLYLLTQKWEDTDAFKLKIIDKNGNILIKRADLKTEEQRDAYTRFNQLVWNLKKLLEKFPLGKTTIARYAAALYLIKEETGNEFDYIFEEYARTNNLGFPTITQMFIEDANTKYVRVFGWLFTEGKDGELDLVEDGGAAAGGSAGSGSSGAACATTVGTSGNTTAGIDINDTYLGKKKKKKTDSGEVVTRSEVKEDLENNIPSTPEFFAGSIVFTCDPNTFHKCRMGKQPYARYKTYVGEDEVGQKIREYGRKYPAKSIVLKNNSTGALLYLRKK